MAPGRAIRYRAEVTPLPRNRRQSLPSRSPADVAEVVFTVRAAEDGGYLARANGLAILVGAATVAELHAAVNDALRGHFGPHRPPGRVRLHLIDDEVLAGWPLDLNPPG